LSGCSATAGGITTIGNYRQTFSLFAATSSTTIGSTKAARANNTNAFYPSGYNDVSALANVWVQWAVTGNSSGQIFYINGQQVGTTVQTVVGNAHDYTGQIPGQPFGYVANMLLYTTILTQEQIQQNYYGYKGVFGV
jgi:hypothetical protein